MFFKKFLSKLLCVTIVFTIAQSFTASFNAMDYSKTKKDNNIVTTQDASTQTEFKVYSYPDLIAFSLYSTRRLLNSAGLGIEITINNNDSDSSYSVPGICDTDYSYEQSYNESASTYESNYEQQDIYPNGLYSCTQTTANDEYLSITHSDFLTKSSEMPCINNYKLNQLISYDVASQTTFKIYSASDLRNHAISTADQLLDRLGITIENVDLNFFNVDSQSDQSDSITLDPSEN